MKYLCVLLLFITSLGGIKSYAQESNKERRISLKLYNQIMIEGINPTKSISLGVTPAVNLTTKKGHFHELELSDFSYKRDKNESINGVSETVNKQLGLRYSFNYSINKKGRLRAFIGAGFNTNLKSYKSKNNYLGIEHIKSEDEHKIFTNSLDFNVTPRLVWNVSDKWFLDINVPVNVYNFLNTKESNKEYLFSEQMKTNSSTAFPNKYTVNVGVGFRF